MSVGVAWPPGPGLRSGVGTPRAARGGPDGTGARNRYSRREPEALAMPITLYGPARAPFTLKVRAALVLKKLDHQLREPSGPEDYRRWSPQTGLLPVIDVDGIRVPDSSAILDLLDERFPQPPLVSPDPKVAASQRGLEQWVEQTFTFYWMNYLRQLVEREEAGSEASGGRGGLRRRILRRAPARPASALGAEFPRRLDDLANFLGSRPFFYADQISRADLAVYSFLHNLPEAAGAELGAEVERRAVVRDHLARVDQVTRGRA